MIGTAVLIFLGETLMGTLLFVAIAVLIKLLAEREETVSEEAIAAEKALAQPSVVVKS